jgi:hypothetical protein
LGDEVRELRPGKAVMCWWNPEGLLRQVEVADHWEDNALLGVL